MTMEHTLEDRIIDQIIDQLGESGQTNTDSNHRIVRKMTGDNYYKVAVNIEHLMTTSGLFDMSHNINFKLTHHGFMVKKAGGWLKWLEEEKAKEEEHREKTKLAIEVSKLSLITSRAAIAISIGSLIIAVLALLL